MRGTAAGHPHARESQSLSLSLEPGPGSENAWPVPGQLLWWESEIFAPEARARAWQRAESRETGTVQRHGHLSLGPLVQGSVIHPQRTPSTQPPTSLLPHLSSFPSLPAHRIRRTPLSLLFVVLTRKTIADNTANTIPQGNRSLLSTTTTLTGLRSGVCRHSRLAPVSNRQRPPLVTDTDPQSTGGGSNSSISHPNPTSSTRFTASSHTTHISRLQHQTALS